MDGADGVYPASEDTHLLIDALKKDRDFLASLVDSGGVCLEVGCGSGEVTETLSTLLPHYLCVSTDVNRLAAEKTTRLVEERRLENVEVLVGDMFTSFRPGINFDVIVFNPPYVPTDGKELQRALLEKDICASWAGGHDGREVIDRFLLEYREHLQRRGVMYLVLLEANKPADVAAGERIKGNDVTFVLTRRAGMEQLYILRVRRKKELVI